MIEQIDREGMLQDVRAMGKRVWARNSFSLVGPALEFKNEAEELEKRLMFRVFCPYLENQGLTGQVEVSGWRCAQCNVMQYGGTVMIWIPDGTIIGDPQWAAEEALGEYARFGGDGSGWCIKCVRKLLSWL